MKPATQGGWHEGKGKGKGKGKGVGKGKGKGKGTVVVNGQWPVASAAPAPVLVRLLLAELIMVCVHRSVNQPVIPVSVSVDPLSIVNHRYGVLCVHFCPTSPKYKQG